MIVKKMVEMNKKIAELREENRKLTESVTAEMTDEELSLLAPWNKDVQETCGKCDH